MCKSSPRGFLSATRYEFENDQADDILRTAAYRRDDYCRSVIWFPPEDHSDILSSIATPFRRISTAPYNFFYKLPLLVFEHLLLYLDMKSAFNLRQACLNSRERVDLSKEYKRITTYGLNVFCALLRTRFADRISIADFHRELVTKPCSVCGKLAGFINLLTWKRSCFKCLREASETQLQLKDWVEDSLQMTENERSQLTILESLPGRYGLYNDPFLERHLLVSTQQAKDVVRSRGENKFRYPNTGPMQNLDFLGTCALPHFDNKAGRADHGVSCAGCLLAMQKGIITKSQAVKQRDKVYDREEFLKHFRRCKQAQLLWESSDGGTKEPEELPDTAKVGGYYNTVGLGVTREGFRRLVGDIRD
ncbi:hypothetical protein FSARC_6604 [Fusarium sarcochroum]|uniref:F-box domain-containing protein n=1 Tax=Fusarium sarcochroum TaxID=1208366 RepID=A0A8H4TX21_9HYPO|nr:hypothetical protein FSARC_6604 [Fusarium sarcochroum]